MHISELKNSRFLTKHDCEPPITGTVGSVDKDNVAAADQPEDLKWVLTFVELDIKPMVTNYTNAQNIARLAGSENSDDWHGTRIECFNEESISFGGRQVGGIRVRAPSRLQPEPNSVPRSNPVNSGNETRPTASGQADHPSY